jgi:hypothetical protein
MRYTKEKIEDILKEVATGSISYIEGTNLVVAELERVKTEAEDERDRQRSINIFSRLVG